ncbi:MAG: alpha-amylase family glycosyl hydrolase [Bacteroidota bacterium]
MNENEPQYLWWQEGIIYQVYPRSYQDSNNDGVGDIQGIIHRLDYLQWLGVTIIWLSPVYPSPMKDFGYDISGYTDIHPLFGTLADFDTLVTELHTREMKLVIDLVPNHTSDEHPWFTESRSSRDDPRRDWYIWRDAGPNGEPPNNWLSVFGGSAWEWDENTQQYYYHAFLTAQPDLNFRNPDVVEAMKDIMRFWLDRGVDGFRVDVMWHMIKDELLRDNPPNPAYQEHMVTYDSLLPVFSTDQPEVHSIVHEMRKVLDAYNERMMIGEIYLPLDKLVTYYGIDNRGAHLPFNFLLLHVQWDALSIAALVAAYEAALPPGAWPNWVLGNHDQSRIRSRVGSEQARIAAMLLLTLRGTPTIYYGDELGMRDVSIPLEEIQDPQGLNMPEKDVSRDPARTPMQWDTSEHSGFTTATPWLRTDRAYMRDNVATQLEDEDSILRLYNRLATLRQNEPALKTGSYKSVAVNRNGLAYIREANGTRFLIALNFSHRPCRLQLHGQLEGEIILATAPGLEGTAIDNTLYLGGDDGIIVRLAN